MEILIDREITAGAEVFRAFGRVRLFDGRRLRRSDVRDAEMLAVRSVTRVDESLLKGTPVRFVGTATAGIDHVDTGFLEREGIAYADAAGCNARAVSEHVATCVYAFSALRDIPAKQMTVGIIGYGHVGRALAMLLDDVGIRYLVRDPPLAEVDGAISSAALGEILDCDVVTLHVPLTTAGTHRTFNLLDAEAIQRLRPDALLINAARGGVVDETALCRRLDLAEPLYAAIDCWADEPDIDTELLRRAWVATPHIAGHSFEARLEATRILHAAANAFCGLDTVFPSGFAGPAVVIEPSGSGVSSAADLLAQVHPLAVQTARLRRMLSLPGARRSAHFDDIRARFGLRREFASCTIASGRLAPDTVDDLGALGFGALIDA